MYNPKLIKAFLIPPLIPALGYFGLMAYPLATSAGAPAINLGMYLFWLISVAYLITLLVFIPIYFLLLYFGRNNYKLIILTSAVTFFLLAWGITSFRMEMLFFATLSAISGVVCAYVFCKFAGRDHVAGI